MGPDQHAMTALSSASLSSTVREPQQQRSRVTRQRLVQATIDALAADGWAAATVATVAAKAGVSRGAAQHHFPTRETLISAVLEHVFDQMTATARATTVDGSADLTARAECAVERAVSIYTGTEFKAALQVWAAAASDQHLRELILPMEAKFARAAHQMTIDILDPDRSHPDAHRVAQVALDLARGLGLADTLSDDSRRREQVTATAVAMVCRTLAQPYCDRRD